MSNGTDHDPNAVASIGKPEHDVGSWWRLPLLMLLVLAAILATRLLPEREPAPAASSAPVPVPTEPVGETVALAIRFGDGREQVFDAIAWRAGMTVDDLMSAVRHQSGAIEYEATGDGAMKFLTSISGVANDPANGRGWTYQVNSRRADRSFAVYELRAGDRVLWTFGPLE